MIKQENPNFVASFYAPNPMEVTYWIDLSTDANGNVIKSYTGNDWLPVNYFTNTDQSVEIKKLKQEIADEVNRAKQAEQKLTNDLNGKANKSTTLAGYGINDAYTKLETDAKAIKIAQAECARLVASAPETLNTLDEIYDRLPDDQEKAIYYVLGACSNVQHELSDILRKTNVAEMLKSPEQAFNHANEYSQGLQNKYLKEKMKKPSSLQELMNLRKQLNNLTKEIGLKLIND